MIFRFNWICFFSGEPAVGGCSGPPSDPSFPLSSPFHLEGDRNSTMEGRKKTWRVSNEIKGGPKIKLVIYIYVNILNVYMIYIYIILQTVCAHKKYVFILCWIVDWTRYFIYICSLWQVMTSSLDLLKHTGMPWPYQPRHSKNTLFLP